MKQLQFYTLPVKSNEGRVYDSNKNFMFQFENTHQLYSLSLMLIDCINAKATIEKFEGHPTRVEKHPNQEIWVNNEHFITIRGWGNLTGTGAHNFSTKKAIEIQDNLQNFLIYKLIGK